MSELPVPVRKALHESADEVAVQRMWRNIGRKRAERERARPRARVIALVAVAAVLFAVLGGRYVLRPSEPVAAPLHLAGGAEIVALSADAKRTISFDDGSQVTLGAGAAITPLENTSGAFVSFLLGTATFDVKPGGSRRWSIECGLATVEVVGTRFVIEASPQRARIVVEQGFVLVRGERVPDRVQRLGAGQSIEILGVVESPPTAPTPSVVEAPVRPRPSAIATALPPPSPSAPNADWRDLAKRGQHAEAYRVLGSSGIAKGSADASTVDDLLALADVARLSGHPADAVAPLSRIANDYAGDSRASLAAFTLGRLYLDTLGQPARAAQAFAQAIALGIPGGLAEDAQARLVEARARAGDQVGAKAAAAEYRRRFPNGKRADAVAKWAGTD